MESKLTTLPVHTHFSVHLLCASGRWLTYLKRHRPFPWDKLRTTFPSLPCGTLAMVTAFWPMNRVEVIPTTSWPGS